MLLKVANLLKKSSKKSAKKAIFDLFLAENKKSLINQHISRDLGGF